MKKFLQINISEKIMDSQYNRKLEHFQTKIILKENTLTPTNTYTDNGIAP